MTATQSLMRLESVGSGDKFCEINQQRSIDDAIARTAVCVYGPKSLESISRRFHAFDWERPLVGGMIGAASLRHPRVPGC